MNESKTYVSTKRASELLGLHHIYVRFLARNKKILAKKVLGRYKIPLSEIERILEGKY